MRRIIVGCLIAVAILLATGFYWRLASRRRQLPCPHWLAWLLVNPVVDRIAGTQATLDRIGLRSAERGLDVGSGPGRLAIPAARRVDPSGVIVALDLQPEMLARLKDRAAGPGVTNIVTKCGDITGDHRLPPDSFDRAWLVTVLGEIPDRAAALRNVYQVLKPGGVLSITEILGDPHYQPRAEVLRLGRKTGFAPTEYWGSWLAFAQNFVRPIE